MYSSFASTGDLGSPVASVLRNTLHHLTLKHPLNDYGGASGMSRSVAQFDFNSFVFSREIRSKIKTLANECKEKLEHLKKNYYAANNEVDLAFQPLID